MHAPQGGPQGYVPPVAPRTSASAIMSLIFGILGCVPLLTSILAVIFGIVGIRATRDPRYTGKGIAITGLILGILGILGWGTMGGTLYTYYIVSKPIAAVAHQFTGNVANGNAQAAQALCESSVTKDELAALADQFQQWGTFKDLTIPVREMKSTGGQTTWDLEGLAEFSSGMHEAKFSLRKQPDGSYKITSAEFQ